MSLPWFRMYSEFSGDPLVQSLAFEDQRHYIIILCLKCNGLLDRKIAQSRRNGIISAALGLDVSTADEVKKRLMEIDLISKNWQPKAWDKRQYKSDNSTQRTRKYRKTKETCDVSGTSGNSHSDAPDTDTDTDTEKHKKTKQKKFIPPTLDDVSKYCIKRNNNVDPDRFFNHYEANGWMRGKNKIKNWKACVRTWELTERKNNETRKPMSAVEQVAAANREAEKREQQGQSVTETYPRVVGADG